MTYAEMIAACEAAGHDMSEARKNLTTKSASGGRPKPDAVLVTLALDDVASALDEAIAAEIEPLIARLDELEAAVRELQGGEKASAGLRQKVRVPSLRRVV